MKNVAYIILLIMNFGILKAQTESGTFDISGKGFDSTYYQIDRKSYTITQADTLEFNDGSDIYRMIEIQRFRPDTAMPTKSATYNLNQDILTETLTYPVYPEKLKKLPMPVIDTIFDPSDPQKYQIEKIDSIKIDFAKSYSLNPTTFFQTIRKIERMAEFQGLEIATIVPTFYGNKKVGLAIELVKNEDFNDVDFIKVTFLFNRGTLMMDYPIIFEK